MEKFHISIEQLQKCIGDNIKGFRRNKKFSNDNIVTQSSNDLVYQSNNCKVNRYNCVIHDSKRSKYIGTKNI